VLFSGRRYDTGDRADYLRTVIKLAVERDDLGPELLAWLHAFVAQHPVEPVLEPVEVPVEEPVVGSLAAEPQASPSV
jgi:hypothetical protein